MALLRTLPLFLVILLIYNALLLVVDNMAATLASSLFTVHLMSGAAWTLTVSDLFILAGVVLLYMEIFKAIRTSMASVIDHTLSTLVFVAFGRSFDAYEAPSFDTVGADGQYTWELLLVPQ